MAIPVMRRTEREFSTACYVASYERFAYLYRTFCVIVRWSSPLRYESDSAFKFDPTNANRGRDVGD